MSKQTLINKIDQLPPEQIATVENFVDRLRPPDAQSERELEALLEQRLFAMGLLSEIKPPIDLSSYQDFDPIENKGKPLSEVIIEERR